jgi:hypothetical protein
MALSSAANCNAVRAQKQRQHPRHYQVLDLVALAPGGPPPIVSVLSARAFPALRRARASGLAPVSPREGPWCSPSAKLSCPSRQAGWQRADPHSEVLDT